MKKSEISKLHNKIGASGKRVVCALLIALLSFELLTTPVFATGTGESADGDTAQENGTGTDGENAGEPEDETLSSENQGQTADDDTETGAAENEGGQDAAEDSSRTGASSSEEAGLEVSLVNRYDSADTCVLVRTDELRQTVTLRNHDIGKNYTLRYDDATYLMNERGTRISVSDFVPGDLVYVTFLKSNRIINSLSKLIGANGPAAVTSVEYPSAPMASDIFCYTDLASYQLPLKPAGGTREEKIAVLAGKRYVMDYRALVLVDGKVSSASSVMEGDLITAVGVGDEVYCVQVTKGHGYLRLSSTQVGKNSLVGAWIELDNFLVRKITDNMMLTTTEGEYTLYIVGQGANWSTPVTVTRGKETVINTSGIPIAEPEKGIVNFMIAPKETGLIIDGEDFGVTDSVTLEYGIHTLELYAEGYETEVKYLRVASKEADIRLVLTPDGSKTEKSNDSSGGSESTGGTQSGTGASSSDAGTNGSSAQTGTGSSADNTGTSGTGASASGDGTSGSTGGTTTGAQSSNTGAGWASPSGGSQTSAQGVAVQDKWIHVEAPTGAGLYLDGTYIGVIPCVFPKVSGMHTVNLRQDGYRIISYNIEVDTQKSDLYFRFPEMEAE